MVCFISVHQTGISSAHYSATIWPGYTAHTVYCHWSTGRSDGVVFLPLLLHMLLCHEEVGYSLKCPCSRGMHKVLQNNAILTT